MPSGHAGTGGNAPRRARKQRVDKYEAKAGRRAEREASLAAKVQALSERKYGLIAADPPWRFEVRSRETGLDRSADNHYPTMTVEEIKALDVPSIAARDCVLLLWTTVPHLEQALEVVRAWGFTYKSMLTWDKEVFGTGHWLRNQTEHLIIATRGRVVAPAADQKIPSLYRERKGAHSAKPDGVAEWIERLYPKAPKIELFARRQRPGWDCWGNEAGPAAPSPPVPTPVADRSPRL